MSEFLHDDADDADDDDRAMTIPQCFLLITAELKRVFFLFQNNPKELDPSSKTNLVLGNCFGLKNHHLKTKEIRQASHFRQKARATWFSLHLSIS